MSNDTEIQMQVIMENFKKEIQALIEEYNDIGDIDLFISEFIKLLLSFDNLKTVDLENDSNESDPTLHLNRT